MRKRTPPARRLLVAAHSHPSITHGGGELSAKHLHEAMGAEPGWQSWFVAGARDGSNKTGAHFAQPFDDRQYVFDAGAFEWFRYANRDRHFPGEFAGVLREVGADIVHFHHYIVLGVEAFLHARRALPDSRIVLTLHEFLAICHNHGQMVKRGGTMLCRESSPADCTRCYPDYSRADFFLRKAYIMRFLDMVDHFIAPSAMLAERYVRWGLPEARVSVIENILPAGPPAAAAPRDPGLLRVGYFGQISALKGIGVALDAAALLLEAGETQIRFDIHGDHSNQPQEFRDHIVSALKAAGHNVRFHGPYDNARVDALMRASDLVLVPSIWWENSPLVIQEAFRNRRPVVCSDIGGMAEKVRDGVDGLHFPVGNAAALADLLRELARDRGRLDRLAKTMRVPEAPRTIARQHAALYEQLLTAPPRAVA